MEGKNKTYKQQNKQLLVEVKEDSYLSRERKFPTPRPMKLTFIPPIPLFFPPAAFGVIVPQTML